MAVELILLSGASYRGEAITGPRLRALLAVLAADLRTGCSTAWLVDGIWPDARPENPTKALQILVSRTRAQLGADLITTTPTGYRLALREDQVDASAVQLAAAASARQARAGDHAAALSHAETGLALWAGPGADPDHGLTPDDPVAELRAERAPVHRSLVRARALALSRLRRRSEALEPLTELAAAHPRDEEVLLELLRCEAETIGVPAALARYEAYRAALRGELGADPGSALRALHQELLRGGAPAVRHGVPHEPNPLLGRDDDIAAVTGLLHNARVTSIVGAGGLGKTRLAYAVSRNADQRSVHVVGLVGVGADGDVAGEVASALGVGESAPTASGHVTPGELVTRIAEVLEPGPALLVLDNCEHLLRGVGELVRALVSVTEELRVLITSRAPLGLSSEVVYQLPELSLETTVELFSQRARAARPGVELPADAVAEVCGRLDGLPLAVELAAARVRVMSVPEIARRLDDRFALLRGGARDTPERHHTLHAVVDWSWHLLDGAGQAALRAVSIFPGGFTADAAARLLGDRAGEVLEILELLVDQSLLKVVDTPSGARFRMLETVREFSAARRDAAGETERITEDFLAWTRDFGVAHHQGPFGPDPYTAVELLRAEQDNLVLAVRLGLSRSDGATVASTAAVLVALWAIESAYTRMTSLANDCAWLLSHYRPELKYADVTRTALTLSAVFSYVIEGPRATRLIVALRRLPKAEPNSVASATAQVLSQLPPDRETLRDWSDSDLPYLAASASVMESYLCELDGDLQGALRYARRMVDALERVDSPWLLGLSHCRVAELSLPFERGADVREHLIAALPVLDRLGAGSDAAGLRLWLVLANLQLGAYDEAERWLDQAALVPYDLVPYDEENSSPGYGLAVRSQVLLARGEIDAGLRLLRRVADGLRNPGGPIAGQRDPLLFSPWVVEGLSVVVVAHARHGRLELIEEIVDELPGRLSTMLANPVANPPPYLVEFPLYGALLLALGMANIERGATESGVRLIALAERCQFMRNFQPTMSGASAREAAESANGPAYAEAVSAYAGLDRNELRAAALAVLSGHDRKFRS